MTGFANPDYVLFQPLQDDRFSGICVEGNNGSVALMRYAEVKRSSTTASRQLALEYTLFGFANRFTHCALML
jgi:hypothetical protein